MEPLKEPEGSLEPHFENRWTEEKKSNLNRGNYGWNDNSKEQYKQSKASAHYYSFLKDFFFSFFVCKTITCHSHRCGS